jgi:hypothetical protein
MFASCERTIVSNKDPTAVSSLFQCPRCVSLDDADMRQYAMCMKLLDVSLCQMCSIINSTYSIALPNILCGLVGRRSLKATLSIGSELDEVASFPSVQACE